MTTKFQWPWKHGCKMKAVAVSHERIEGVAHPLLGGHPGGQYTHILNVCEGCGEQGVNTVRGTFSLAQVLGTEPSESVANLLATTRGDAENPNLK